MKRIWTYIGITFVLTWFIEFAMIGGGGLAFRWAQPLIILVMVMPALGSVIARGLSREGFSDLYLRPEKGGRRTVSVFLAAWLLPIVAIIVGAALYFLLNPSMFDGSMSHSTEVYQALYAEMGREYTDAQIRRALWSQLFFSMFLTPCLNLVPTLGCELGFRGYLLPRLLENYKQPAAVLISGLVWGIWYGPLVEMGQYYGTTYGGYPYLGMGAMCLLCIVLGVFLSWLTLRTKSCVSAAIALAVFNSFSSAGVYFCSSDAYSPFVGPAPTGIIGGAGFILLAIFCVRKWIKAH